MIAAAICLLSGFALSQSVSPALELPSPQVADLRAPANAGTSRAAAEASARGRSGSRNVLRCWQFGRLIYEGQGLVRNDKAAAAGLNTTGGGTVHFYDLQNATCILEQSGV